MTGQGPDGVLVVDKPRGPTSHDVVAKLRRLLGTRRVGHAGTLDPMATGVLVVAVGEATKLVPWLTADDKSYEAEIALGVGTDTLDADGQEVSRGPLPAALAGALRELSAGSSGIGTPPLLESVLAAERARTAQVPPAFSAIHVDGERAHALARRGESPILPPREVTVRRLEIRSGGLEPSPHLRVSLEVAKGYFVRSLARDLAEGLGTHGHLTALRRTRSGGFSLTDAVTLEAGRDALFEALLPPPAAAARALPTCVLTAAGVLAARRGQRVPPSDLSGASPVPAAWLDEAGALVAIGEVDEHGVGRVLRGFGG
jgi:tRNA pseudouridine55 synthase